MEEDNKTAQEVQDFTQEYNEICRDNKNSVLINLQWEKEGDFFKKLTLYDDSYISIPTLGNTTLLNNY